MVSIEYITSAENLERLLVEHASIVHYKGFGPRILSECPVQIVAELAKADLIVFDGDNYTDDSFTLAFGRLHRLCAAERRSMPAILAFKILKDKGIFDTSWRAYDSACKAAHPELPPFVLHCFLVPVLPATLGSKYGAQPAALSDALPDPCALHCLRCFEAVHARGAGESFVYVALGAYAVKVTRKVVCKRTGQPPQRQVIVWGTLDVVVCEFAVCYYGGIDPDLPWKYFHAVRERDGERQEGKFLGLKGHPRVELVTEHASPSLATA